MVPDARSQNGPPARALLITQCLQRDFVLPVGPDQPLPNLLHVGAAEARRLMGEKPAEGPVARFMEWAYARDPGELAILHIRDWHTSGDPGQAAHLARFGAHCMAEGGGAEPAFAVPATGRAHVMEIRSGGLNDFEGTGLSGVLAVHAGRAMNVGIAGVWTEAKVFFLAYELTTRYPGFRVGVCSALCAGSSREQHFAALEQMQRLLGVTVCDSVGSFMEFLGGRADDYPLPGTSGPAPTFETARHLDDSDRDLLRYLFRGCRAVRARELGGGYSGSRVLATESEDRHGHRQAPHVVKIGERQAIARERTAFERIEDVLGNSAPRIADFADLGARGAVKYRYASMTGGATSTFRERYVGGAPVPEIEEILRTVFVDQLGRFYAAAELESCNLLGYYAFEARWAAGVRANVRAVLGADADAVTIAPAGGVRVPNVCGFYEDYLSGMDPRQAEGVYFAYVHGDLNGANIVLDSRGNVWLIDFFHTHRGHILRDLVKLENDLLYTMTDLPDEEALEQATRLTDALVGLDDLAVLPPSCVELGVDAAIFGRTVQIVRLLRSFYAGLLRGAAQPRQWWIAALRYAVHTLGFDEAGPRQKRWALYTACRCAERIRASHGGARL